jgi:glycosyltransferase involved in cell wall biosynthesis
MSFSVVVPLFRSESGIDVLVSRLTELSVEFQSELEAVLVIDGSPDNSWNILLER